MAHKLSFITRADIMFAIKKIDDNGIPADHQWNQYWIFYGNKPYPFKYTTELAAEEAGIPKRTVDFQSNSSNRKAISNLGFNIRFLNPTDPGMETGFWIGASKFGQKEKQEEKLDEFIRDKIWATDHDPASKEGKSIFKKLRGVKL